MSLDFNISKIAPSVKHDADGNMSLVTRTLIFATMNVGIGEITEENAAEFFARLSIFERVLYPYRHNADGPTYFTEQDVKNHIGLTTNVFPKESDAKWRKRIMDHALHEAQERYKKATTETTEQKAGA